MSGAARILFMHIHKTAGTALARQCFAALPPGDICPARFEWQIVAAGAERLRRYRVFHGHISPAAVADEAADITCITMLREPRARLLSAFFYWKGNAPQAPGNAFYRRVSELDLLGFLRCDDPIIRDATFNVQARLVAGGRFGATDDTRTNVIGPDVPGECLADRAMAGLDRFDLVGISERYKETMDLVAGIVGVRQPMVTERTNTGRNIPLGGYKPMLDDPEICSELDRLTGIDARVYAQANTRLTRAAFTYRL